MTFFVYCWQLYELSDDPKRKEFLDDLFSFMQKKGKEHSYTLHIYIIILLSESIIIPSFPFGWKLVVRLNCEGLFFRSCSSLSLSSSLILKTTNTTKTFLTFSLSLSFIIPLSHSPRTFFCAPLFLEWECVFSRKDVRWWDWLTEREDDDRLRIWTRHIQWLTCLAEKENERKKERKKKKDEKEIEKKNHSFYEIQLRLFIGRGRE